VTVTKFYNTAESIHEFDDGARFLVYIFKPDDKCKFEYQGTVVLDGKARTQTIVMPAGRAFFRVYITGGVSISEDAFFLHEENQEYSIVYQYLGSAGNMQITYKLAYLKNEGANRWRSVDVDHWSICKREKGVASN